MTSVGIPVDAAIFASITGACPMRRNRSHWPSCPLRSRASIIAREPIGSGPMSNPSGLADAKIGSRLNAKARRHRATQRELPQFVTDEIRSSGTRFEPGEDKGEQGSGRKSDQNGWVLQGEISSGMG